MDVFEAIKGRRSIRHYKPDPVDDEMVQAVLEAAGSSPADVVRCVVYMADTEDFQTMNEIYAPFFPDPPPARSTVIVAELPLGLQILIEATALKGSGA